MTAWEPSPDRVKIGGAIPRSLCVQYRRAGRSETLAEAS